MIFNEASKKIYEANKEKGFWDNERNVGEMLMLITSELGEAMEAHRKGRFAKLADFNRASIASNSGDDFKVNFEANIKDTFEDEVADALIRILDMCGGLGIDIDSHVNTKLAYNRTRERLHGKNY